MADEPAIIAVVLSAHEVVVDQAVHDTGQRRGCHAQLIGEGACGEAVCRAQQEEQPQLCHSQSEVSEGFEAAGVGARDELSKQPEGFLWCRV